MGAVVVVNGTIFDPVVGADVVTGVEFQTMLVNFSIAGITIRFGGEGCGDAEEFRVLFKLGFQKGFEPFILEDARLGNSVRSLLRVKIEVKKGDALVSRFRARLAEIAVELGFVETPIAYNSWVREVTASIVRVQVKLSSARRDLQVVQGVLTLDDLDKSLNLYAGRVREWYGLYFPELGDLVERHEPYLNLVLSFCDRGSFDVVSLKEIGFSEEKSRAIVESASDSLGAEMGEEDLKQIRSVSELALKMYAIRRNLESHLEVLMKECAPNITVLVGSSIGARLFALAGGLDKLARMF